MAFMAEPPIENSDYWRKRAEEARTLSERMLDAYRGKLRTDCSKLRPDRQFDFRATPRHKITSYESALSVTVADDVPAIDGAVERRPHDVGAKRSSKTSARGSLMTIKVGQAVIGVQSAGGPRPGLTHNHLQPHPTSGLGPAMPLTYVICYPQLQPHEPRSASFRGLT